MTALLLSGGPIGFDARLHAACCKQMLDEFLQKRSRTSGEPFQAFEIAPDHRLFVHGKPRYDAVRDCLRSRRSELPDGGHDEPPTR